MSARPTKRSYVLCLGNRRYKASLIVRRLYQTIEDDEALAHGMIRVIDESGEDYLFPQRLFANLVLPKEIHQRLKP